MNRNLQDRVVSIAIGVRNWTQGLADETLYHPGDLLGWCAIASGELHKRLKSFGIKSTICMSESDAHGHHCFVMVEDYVVDVTATQFDEYMTVPILIMHSKEAEVNDFHVPIKEFGTGKALRQHQLRDKWPSKQLAYK